MDEKILTQNLGLLVGQDQARQLLAKYLMTDSCSAYLLVGPPYVGKGFLARLMAASLHSEADTHKVHPDTLIFDDVLAKNSGEEEENKWKQSVDDFIHAIYLSPVSSSKKVGIIENIDRFSVKALNALLKILEEPPRKAALILTAQEVGHVLPTIISRVQVVRLHYLPDEEIALYLRNQNLSSQEVDQISEITLLANGAIGMANQLVRNKKLLNQVLKRVDSFRIWLRKDISQILSIANVKDRQEAIDLVNTWLNLAHRALADKLNARLSDLVPDDCSAVDLLGLISRLELALASLQANANVRVTLESTMLSVV